MRRLCPRLRQAERPGRRRGERGVASLELLGILPAVLVIAVITLQVAATLWTVRAAEEAARTAARVYSLGGSNSDITDAADDSLPGAIRLLGAQPYGPDYGVRVRAEVPGLIPLGQRFTVTREVVMP